MTYLAFPPQRKMRSRSGHRVCRSVYESCQQGIKSLLQNKKSRDRDVWDILQFHRDWYGLHQLTAKDVIHLCYVINAPMMLLLLTPWPWPAGSCSSCLGPAGQCHSSQARTSNTAVITAWLEIVPANLFFWWFCLVNLVVSLTIWIWQCVQSTGN